MLTYKYYPQTNGLLERYDQTLIAKLHFNVNDNR